MSICKYLKAWQRQLVTSPSCRCCAPPGRTSLALLELTVTCQLGDEMREFGESTLLGTNISPEKSILKMIFLFPRWDMLIPGGYLKITIITLFGWNDPLSHLKALLKSDFSEDVGLPGHNFQLVQCSSVHFQSDLQLWFVSFPGGLSSWFLYALIKPLFYSLFCIQCPASWSYAFGGHESWAKSAGSHH